MKTVYAARATTILYRILRCHASAADTYLLPANICWVVPLTFLAAGKRVDFLDVDAKTLCLNKEMVMERLQSKTAGQIAGVLFLRTYGIENDDVDFFRDIRSNHPGVLLIDDRCLCRPLVDSHGPEKNGVDVVLFSTSYAKQIDLGYGGFAHLRDGVAYEEWTHEFDKDYLSRVEAICSSHSQSKSSLNHDTWLKGPNWIDTRAPKSSWSQTCQSITQRWDSVMARKRHMNAIYSAEIPKYSQLPPEFSQWRFNIRVPQQQALIKKIFSAGYFASTHFASAAVLFGGSDCPNAEYLSDQIVNLSSDSRIDESEVLGICRIVNEHLDTQRGSDN